MRRRSGTGLRFGSAAAVLLWGSLGGVAGAGEAPGAPAGMRAHIDPRTGAIVREPVAPQAPAGLPTAASQSAEGLVERPAPGGGVMLDLQGRFLSPITATAAPDGAPHAECHGPQPGSAGAR
jgi:hypothetical protein